jgi:predicted DNA-binding protein
MGKIEVNQKEGRSMEKENLNEQIRLNVWLKRDIYQKLQRISDLSGRSLSDVVREALFLYVNEMGKKIDLEPDILD